jgi:hypothetical protein
VTLNRPLFLQQVPGDPQISYPAQDLRTLADALILGRGVSAAGDLAVSQRAAGANFSVDVANGHAVLPGNSISDQGKYICQSTAVENVTLASAPGAGFTRFDLIYAQVRDRQADGGSSYDWVIDKVTGTVSGVLPTTPANAIPLASVGPIVNTTASITNSLITDLRSYFTLTGFRTKQATVATLQTTTSTSYTNLATVGPQITVPLYSGQVVEVAVRARLFNADGPGFAAVMSWDVSGQATQAASDADSIENDSTAGATLQASGLYTAPSPGVYTFAAKYKAVNATTASFLNRRLTVRAA